MKLQVAERKQAKIKMALQGPSGSGKTMGALLIAYGLCQNWNKIAVIDTENYSASLYAHLGKYSVLNITAPFTPEKYMEAIKVCTEAGVEVIIIDSISHEWEGSGGILDIHSNMTGNSFTNWGKLTPRHNAFVQAILQNPVHIIATIRSKQEYVLSERNGKQVPEKVGLKGVTREGMDYECTLVFDVDIKHNAIASKDRTGLFMDKPDFKITPAIGEQILAWCQQGTPKLPDDALTEQIELCRTYDELKSLYTNNPSFQTSHSHLFSRRKKELEVKPAVTQTLTSNYSANGNGSIK
jgi:AAA domain